MKRKIFSKLLMVALVIAAVGSFVSCKDYDDDINNLQKQIDAKAAISELTALQSTLESKISTATAAAQKAAEDAAAKADASLKATLETAIADAKKAGTDAGTQAGTAIAAANKAQETADGAAAAAKKADEDAKAALADALKTIEETYQTKAEAAAAATEAAKALADVKAIADAAFTKAEAEELKAEVEGLKDELEAAIDEKIDAKIQEVNNAVASVDAIWAAITSIELVQSWSKYAAPTGAHDGIQVLNFQYGHVGKNAKFGDNEGYDEASEVIEYTEGDSIKVQNFVLVRVNPANATLDKDNILLINSKGEAINDYVDVLEPIKYNGLLTRSASYESGLYMIPFQLKTKDVDVEDLKDAVAEYNTDGTIKRNVLFAVAVNNTKDAAAERYVNTTFDLTAAAGKYVPATDFTFTVNGEAFNTLKNRWDGAKVLSEKGQQSTKPENAELAWGKDKSNKTVLPVYESDEVKQAADNSNKATYNVVVESAAAETRNGNDALIVELNKPFTVKMNLPTKIDYYYVLFDKQSAIESAPSEWNAWSKYEVEGLGEMKQANEELELTIKTDKALGDFIGFRVYAVNYDGTLADPDGRAFYVKVGDITRGEVTVTGSWTASVATATVGATKAALTAANVINLEDNTGTIAIDGSKFESLALANATGTIAIDPTTYANGVRTAATDRSLYYVLLGSDGKAAKNWKDITAIKVGLEKAGDWVDYKAADATAGTPEYGKIGFKIEGNDPDDGELINTLNVFVTKSLITTGTEPTYMPTYGPVGGVLTIWMQPESTNAFAAGTAMNARPTAIAAANKAAAYATFGEANMITYVKNAADYVYEFVAAGEAKYDAKSGRYAKGAVANVEVDGATSTVLALAGPVLNNTAAKVTYTKAAATAGSESAIDGTSLEPAQTLEIPANGKYTSKIGDGNTYTLNIYETSEAISCKTPASAAATIGLVAQTLSAKFVHDIDPAYQTYGFKPYNICTAWNAAATAPDFTKVSAIQESTSYYVKYSEALAGNFAFHAASKHVNGVEAKDGDGCNTAGANALLKTGTTPVASGIAPVTWATYFTAENSVWKPAYNTLSPANYANKGLKQLIGWDYATKYDYTLYGTFNSDATGMQDYIQIIFDGATNNLLVRATPAGVGGSSGAAPVGNVPSHFKVIACDAFGKEITLINEAVELRP